MSMSHDDDRPRHMLLCNGWLVIGPDWRNFVATLFILGAPIIAFFVLVAPDVGIEISWILVVVTGVVAFVTYSALLATGLKTPGIIPRSTPAEHEEMMPRSRDFMVNGFSVVTKRCSTCYVYRPPRCSHCAVCNNCVEKFDHHCPWVGTCIGRQNYQMYLVFIFACTLLCLLVIGQSIARLALHATQRSETFLSALQEEPAAAVLIIYCIAGLLFVGALSVLHCYLLATNQTTYEFFRHRYAHAENPFSRTIHQNMFEAFCGATGLYAYHGDSHPAQVSNIPSSPLRTTWHNELHNITSSGLTDTTISPQTVHPNIGASAANVYATEPEPVARGDASFRARNPNSFTRADKVPAERQYEYERSKAYEPAISSQQDYENELNLRSNNSNWPGSDVRSKMPHSDQSTPVHKSQASPQESVQRNGVGHHLTPPRSTVDRRSVGRRYQGNVPQLGRLPSPTELELEYYSAGRAPVDTSSTDGSGVGMDVKYMPVSDSCRCVPGYDDSYIVHMHTDEDDDVMLPSSLPSSIPDAMETVDLVHGPLLGRTAFELDESERSVYENTTEMSVHVSTTDFSAFRSNR